LLTSNRSVIIFGVSILALTLPALMYGDEKAERTIERDVEIEEGGRIMLWNLAGEIHVNGWDKASVGIRAKIHSEGDDRREAIELLDSVKIDIETTSRQLKIKSIFPLPRYSRYHYPGSSEGWDWFSSTSTTTEIEGKRVKISSKKMRNAVTLWVDYEILLPKDREITIKNIVGSISANEVEGSLDIDTSSGDVRLDRSIGSFVVDTGSGNVSVDRIEGSLEIDTGSGDVRVSKSTVKRTYIDTGSGDVYFDSDLDGADRIEIDTGSGNIIFRISSRACINI